MTLVHDFKKHFSNQIYASKTDSDLTYSTMTSLYFFIEDAVKDEAEVNIKICTTCEANFVALQEELTEYTYAGPARCGTPKYTNKKGPL